MEIKCYSHPILSRVYVFNMTYQGDVNLDYLAVIVSRFFTVKLFFSLLPSQSSLEGTQMCSPTLNGQGFKLHLLDRRVSI